MTFFTRINKNLIKYSMNTKLRYSHHHSLHNNFLLNIEKNDGKLIYEILENNINNIEDIMLDVPNANIKIKYIVENLNNDKKELFLNILNNIKNDDSESIDETC